MSSPYVMTATERDAFLVAVRVGILAVDEPDRAPLAVPVWYSYLPGGTIDVIMQRDSRKMRAIDAAGRFTLAVQQEEPPYAYVTAEGPAISVRAVDRQVDLLQMACRYLGEAGGHAYVEKSTGDDDGVVVSMRPEHWLSTDYAKG